MKEAPLLLNKTKASKYLFGYKDTQRLDSLHLPTVFVFGKVWYPRFVLENFVKEKTHKQTRYK